MKKYITLVIAIIACKTIYSQAPDGIGANIIATNPFTNAPASNDAGAADRFQPRASAIEIQCSDDVFFAVNYSGKISRFMLTGNSAVLLDSVTTQSNFKSIGVCNNLSGGNPSPTFYSSFSGQTLWPATFYNDTGWAITSPAQPSNWSLINSGGYLNYCYYMGLSGFVNTDVIRYTGSTYSMLYTTYLTPRRLTIADLAVDSLGNVYFAGGLNTVSDTFYVMSPTGQMLKRIPFTMDCLNAYGAMIINGVYYVAMGSQAAVFPNSLVPLYISSSNVTIGTPISFPDDPLHFADIASCSPGMITSIGEVIQENYPLKVYPNPAKGQLFFNGGINSDWQIIDMYGNTVHSGTCNGASELRLSFLAAGIYTLVLYSNNDRTRTARFVIE